MVLRIAMPVKAAKGGPGFAVFGGAQAPQENYQRQVIARQSRHVDMPCLAVLRTKSGHKSGGATVAQF